MKTAPSQILGVVDHPIASQEELRQRLQARESTRQATISRSQGVKLVKRAGDGPRPRRHRCRPSSRYAAPSPTLSAASGASTPARHPYDRGQAQGMADGSIARLTEVAGTIGGDDTVCSSVAARLCRRSVGGGWPTW
jgi:hypothetical protein